MTSSFCPALLCTNKIISKKTREIEVQFANETFMLVNRRNYFFCPMLKNDQLPSTLAFSRRDRINWTPFIRKKMHPRSLNKCLSIVFTDGRVSSRLMLCDILCSPQKKNFFPLSLVMNLCKQSWSGCLKVFIQADIKRNIPFEGEQEGFTIVVHINYLHMSTVWFSKTITLY